MGTMPWHLTGHRALPHAFTTAFPNLFPWRREVRRLHPSTRPVQARGWEWLFLFSILLFSITAAPASAQDDNLGFVEFRVNALAPIPYLESYLDEDGEPYLQFNALMRALEIPVAYDAGLGTALGFLPDGQTRFELSLERRSVLMGETILPLLPEQHRVIDHKLFVHHAAIAQWFPLRLTWDTEAFRLKAITDYTLPSEEKLRRETRRERLKGFQGDTFTPEEVERDVPWFDPGMFEVSSSASGGKEHPDGGLASLKGVHRFLKGDLEYSVTQSHFDGDTRDARVDYSRLTYYDPLHTWEARLGDTFATFSPLVVGTQSLRGGSFFTGGRRLRFGRTTLIGTAPPGSEVDLYRLGVLVDFTTVDGKGIYRFENLPLAFQNTRFQARIFTPDGKQIHRFHDVSSQEEMVPAGGLASVGAAGQGEQAEGDFTLTGGEARYGVTDWLTLGAYVIELRDFVVLFDTLDKQTNGGAFFLVRPLDWVVLLGEQSEARESEGDAQRLDAFFTLGVFSLEVDRRTFSGDYAPPKRTRSIAFLNTALAEDITKILARGRLFAININLTNTSTRFGQARESKVQESRLDRRLTQNIGLTLINSRERNIEEGQPDSGFDILETVGTYALSSLSRVELLGRRTEPVSAETSTQYRATWLKNHRIDSPWSYRLSYTAFSNREDFSLAQLGYQFSNNIRVTGEVDSEERWLLQATYSLPFRISGEGFETFDTDHFGRAGLTGNVFVDANGNGSRDPGEPAIPDVELLAPGAGDLVSDEEGRFRGWGVTTHRPIHLEVDLLTTDALYLPARQRTALAPRPGEIMEVDIPLVPGGGFEGRLVSRTQLNLSPANGLEMLLVHPDGSIAARSRVEYDGTFLFENIPPGRYRLHGNPDELERRGLTTLPNEQQVKLPEGIEPAWIQLEDMVLLMDSGR